MTKFTVAQAPKAVHQMMDAVDDVFDDLLERLGCHDGTDANLISHWQGDGFRIQVTRNSDGKSLTKFAAIGGKVSA